MAGRISFAALLMLCMGGAATFAASPNDEDMDARLARAQGFTASALAANVRNASVTVQWIGAGDRFWFKRQTRAGDEFVIVDARTGKTSLVADQPSMGPAPPPSHFVASPSGTYHVLLRDANLWVQRADDGVGHQLTSDGVENFGYGDFDGFLDFSKVERRRRGLQKPLDGVMWSPDEKRVLAFRQDLRNVPVRTLLDEYVAGDRDWTVSHEVRAAIAGDAERPPAAGTIVDIDTGASRPIAMDPQSLNDNALRYIAKNGIVWWTRDSSKAFIITANRGGRRYGLTQIDLQTGATRTLIEEQAKFNVRLNPYDYARPNVHVMGDGREAIWYSERSGQGHLYLYDLQRGVVKRAITQGPWVVFDLLQVDERARQIYFTAGGREPGRNPYYRHLYRANLDGGEIRLLTPEDADHDFRNDLSRGFSAVTAPVGSRIAPNGRFIVDSFSTVDRPPQLILRDSAGKHIADILTADASELHQQGWTPPEAITAKAADGVTVLHGVMFKPGNFDPKLRYPVVEATYPGPQMRVVPTRFDDFAAGGTSFGGRALAELGFIVVIVDGRGTAYRDREFRDTFLGTEDVFGAADHVAALRDLARTRPYMDLDRVGVIGASFGGYGSLRATLLNPAFFRVCVSSVGPGEWMGMHQETSVERFFGVPGESAQARAYYEVVSNLRLLPRLGDNKVLLLYGGIDENVPLRSGFQLIDAMIKQDKQFELLIVPDAPHAVLSVPYAMKAAMRFFMTHLGGPVHE